MLQVFSKIFFRSSFRDFFFPETLPGYLPEFLAGSHRKLLPECLPRFFQRFFRDFFRSFFQWFFPEVSQRFISEFHQYFLWLLTGHAQEFYLELLLVFFSGNLSGSSVRNMYQIYFRHFFVIPSGFFLLRDFSMSFLVVKVIPQFLPNFFLDFY